MATQIDRKIPASMQNHKKWQSNRRGFLKTMLAGAVLSQIPWWMSCKSDHDHAKNFLFTGQQLKILRLVQEFLFPTDNNGPGASEIKAEAYLQWVLLDPAMDAEEKRYILHGIGWVEETAQEEKGTDFLKLAADKQREILTYISTQDWGESWFSVLLNFIFEALLSDPVYGANPDGIGWKWLQHNPGNPRPDEDLKYGHFTAFVNRQIHS
jgi:gluconate 2-dehydrogenase gamma chain